MSHWNHRFLAELDGYGNIYLYIHEVYYDDDKKPNGYTKEPIVIGSEDLEGITWTLYSMLECREKPILWKGERFPEELTQEEIEKYKIK